MPRFIRWKTLFTDNRLPSATIVVKPISPESDEICAIVAPTGIDQYPKYIVNFGEVVAFTCMEEMHFPERDFAGASFDEEGLAAYEYLDSTWLRAYSKGEYFLYNVDGGKSERLRHYLIVGGDNNIEVITRNEPTFEVVDSPTTLTLECPL